MDRSQILKRLKLRHSDLVALKVKSLLLFGSIARGDSGPDSDADFLVEFNGRASFDQYMKLKCFLEDEIHRPVDLVTRQGLRPHMRAYVEREAVHVA
jgi:predicted nucleotidyltransferase